ncbi:MAG: hypothetical protein RLY86_3127 [Pseudomonadota bacterium]|jgi:octopine/nopaline transport system permease protein
MNLTLILDSLPQMAAGALLTVQLVGLALLLGFIGAIGVAMARLSTVRPVTAAAGAYVFVFRSTPLLVQLFLIYYGLGQFPAVRDSVLWPILREPYWCAILALTLNTAAYTGEIIRGGIRSVHFGQIEAARSVGMSGALLYRRIILPQALRQALPAYGNEVVQMVQASALASTITLMELTGVARAIAARTFQPVEVFVIAGAVYLVLNIALTRGVRWWERRLSHR